MSADRVAEGKMIQFYTEPYRCTPVFVSGTGTRCLLWFGGQQESFFSVCYLSTLAKSLKGWCLAQVQLPSSRVAYGLQDHVSDAETLSMVVDELVTKYGMTEVALLATSTGLQVMLQAMELPLCTQHVTRLIIHSGVIDPASSTYSEDNTRKRNKAIDKLLEENRLLECAGLEKHYDTAITPIRMSKAAGPPTLQEALWLPCLSEDPTACREAFGKISVPVFFMIGANEKYHPGTEIIDNVFGKVVECMPCAPESGVRLEFWGDSFDEKRRLLRSHVEEHAASIVAFLHDMDGRAERVAKEKEAARLAAEEQQRIALSKMVTA